MTPTGLEADAVTACDDKALRITSPGRAAQSGAAEAGTGPQDASAFYPADPGLARLIDAWPRLSSPIRQAILALVHSGRQGG
jgi:hypothetical protein